MAEDAFNQRKELLANGLSRTIKKRMIKVLVWPVVLYGCEIEGRVIGKRRQGQPRKGMITDLKEAISDLRKKIAIQLQKKKIMILDNERNVRM